MEPPAQALGRVPRQSFLEFDIEAMFAGEVYSDFVLLRLMAHATRLNPREAERPEMCWLEQWTKLAEEQGRCSKTGPQRHERDGFGLSFPL